MSPLPPQVRSQLCRLELPLAPPQNDTIPSFIPSSNNCRAPWAGEASQRGWGHRCDQGDGGESEPQGQVRGPPSRKGAQNTPLTPEMGVDCGAQRHFGVLSQEVTSLSLPAFLSGTLLGVSGSSPQPPHLGVIFPHFGSCGAPGMEEIPKGRLSACTPFPDWQLSLRVPRGHTGSGQKTEH